MTLKPGEIYFSTVVLADDPHRVVVVSREELNGGNYVVVVPFTSRHLERRQRLRNCVLFPRGVPGLTGPCVADAQDITVAHLEDLDLESGMLGKLSSEQMRDVIRAIGYVVGAESEPE